MNFPDPLSFILFINLFGYWEIARKEKRKRITQTFYVFSFRFVPKKSWKLPGLNLVLTYFCFCSFWLPNSLADGNWKKNNIEKARRGNGKYPCLLSRNWKNHLIKSCAFLFFFFRVRLVAKKIETKEKEFRKFLWISSWFGSQENENSPWLNLVQNFVLSFFLLGFGSCKIICFQEIEKITWLNIVHFFFFLQSPFGC